MRELKSADTIRDEDGSSQSNANIYKDGSHVEDLELTFSKAKNGELQSNMTSWNWLPEAQHRELEGLNEHAMNTLPGPGGSSSEPRCRHEWWPIAQARYGFSWPAEEGDHTVESLTSS